jgi:integrase
MSSFDINPKYNEYFYKARRSSSKCGKMVMVLHEREIDNFFKTLVEDEGIPQLNRILIGICLSGGLRISEALSLKKEDFTMDDTGRIYGNIRVLKKYYLKYDVYRDFYVYPRLNSLLIEWLKKKKPQERVFAYRRLLKRGNYKYTPINSVSALNAVKEFLGTNFDNHCLRHSNVSILMNEKYSDIEISKILELTVGMVARYAHVDVRRKMRELYQGILDSKENENES